MPHSLTEGLSVIHRNKFAVKEKGNKMAKNESITSTEATIVNKLYCLFTGKSMIIKQLTNQ